MLFFRVIDVFFWVKRVCAGGRSFAVSTVQVTNQLWHFTFRPGDPPFRTEPVLELTYVQFFRGVFKSCKKILSSQNPSSFLERCVQELPDFLNLPPKKHFQRCIQKGVFKEVC